jgi:DNA-3-methyladenine glycosylase II
MSHPYILYIQIELSTSDGVEVFIELTRLRNSFSTRFAPNAPYDFNLTVKKPAGWPLFSNFEIFNSGVMWTALHIEGELVGLKLSSEGTVEAPQVKAKIFTQEKLSSRSKFALEQILRHNIGADDDLHEFYEIARRDDILRHVLGDLYGMHSTSQSSVFPDAALAILLQMAPIKRSNQMMDCLISNYGEVAEFEGRRVPSWPHPRQLAKLDPAGLASRCKMGYRARRLVELADRIDSIGFPTTEELERMAPEESKKLLLDLPGIGPYSADIIDPHGGFPIDVWSADVFGRLFFGEEPKDKRADIERIRREGLRRWGRWSWMAFFYVVQDLENLSNRLGIRLRLV